jgi:branched-subunit amino acid aminotransferase/4-amino-4-deoxychorismate lyase
MAFWYDGVFYEGDRLSLDPTDPALLYGATLFTTLRVYQTLDHPRTQWLSHLNRLKTSLEDFGWTMPDWDRLRFGTGCLDSPVRRITLFSDGREMVTGRDLPPDLAARQAQGIVAWVAGGVFDRVFDQGFDRDFDQGVHQGIHQARSLPQHKTGNYLLPWHRLQQAIRQGAQEAILVDKQQHWLETATGNLWGYAQGQWWTPPLESGILPGIERQYRSDRFQSLGQTVGEIPWTKDLIAQFTHLAYSNCVVEWVPIRQVIWGEDRFNYGLSNPTM